MDDENGPVEYPLDGTLDLHQFSPRETKEIVGEYISACFAKKIYHLRIVHGKGKGVQRDIIKSLLEKHPAVERFYHEGGAGGGWGATVVDLKEPG